MSITASNWFAKAGYVAGNITGSDSYTVPSGTDKLLIFVYVDIANSTVVPPDITEWASISATQAKAIAVNAGGTGQVHFAYEIQNPTPGTGNLRVRHPTTYFSYSAVCISVDGTLTATYSEFNYANSTSPSVSVASASGDLTIFSLTVNNVDTTAVSETGGQTVPSGGEGGSSANAMHQLSYKVSTGGTNSATWTVTGSQRQSAVAVNFHETSQTITSINGSSDIRAGQVDIPSVTTGFDGLPTSITTDTSGVTCFNIGGSTNAPEFDISGWVENTNYPKLPANVLFTFTRSTQSANLSKTIITPIGYVTQTFAGAITDDNTYITEAITDLGHVAEGADLYYVPYDDLFIFPDGKIQVTSDGTFIAWLRPLTGSTAGKMFYLEVTVVDGAVAGVVGLVARGLAETGLITSGLTARGL